MKLVIDSNEDGHSVFAAALKLFGKEQKTMTKTAEPENIPQEETVEEIDLTGEDTSPEEPKIALSDVSDAIRAAGARVGKANEKKIVDVLTKFVPKGVQARGTNVAEKDYAAFIEALNKLKK